MSEFDTDALQQRWTHSHEEDAAGLSVFRPSGWTFPRSRGRRSFELGPNGSLLGSRPDADDTVASTVGHWRLSGDGVLELDEPGGSSRMQVVEVAADKLVVRR